MAAVTHPRFKLSWLDDADARARCTQQLETAIRASASAVDETVIISISCVGCGRATVDNFFDLGDQTAEQSNAHLE